LPANVKFAKEKMCLIVSFGLVLIGFAQNVSLQGVGRHLKKKQEDKKINNYEQRNKSIKEESKLAVE
jgi:hypothetical protein